MAQTYNQSYRLLDEVPKTADEWYLKLALEETRKILLDILRENEQLKVQINILEDKIQYGSDL